MFEKFKKRLLLILKEIGNILTNTLIPFLGIAILILEFLPVPSTYVKFLKTVEYWLFYASGTAEQISEEIQDKYHD